MDDEDRETQDARQDPLPEPITKSSSPPCGLDDRFPAEVTAQIAPDRSSVTLTVPEHAGVVQWRIGGSISYADLRTSFEQWLSPGTSLVFTLPADAWMDDYQRDWLSSVVWWAYPVSERGEEMGVTRLPRLFVVWPDGPQHAPRWLDAQTKREEAPLGAWSETARVGLVVPEIPELLEIAPPRSTP